MILEKDGEFRKEVRKVKKKRHDDWDEKILSICNKIFWPVLILWVLTALAKLLLIFGVT